MGFNFYNETGIKDTSFYAVEAFTKEIENYCNSLKLIFEKYWTGNKDNFKISNFFTRNEAICKIKFNANLACWILMNGIGIFVISDVENKTLSIQDKSDLSELNQYSQLISLSYQKRISQYYFKNQLEDNPFSKELSNIYSFEDKTWNIIEQMKSIYKEHFSRPKSSNQKYKYHGISYILTICCFNNNLINEDEIYQLMYESSLSESRNKNKWNKISSNLGNKIKIDKETKINRNDVHKIESLDYDIYFSWAGVCLSAKHRGNEELALANTLDDLLKINNINSLTI